MQILAAREVILRLDQAQDRRTLSPEEIDLRKELKQKSLGLASLERTIARARSRITWLRDGDACTRLFRLHASYRKKKNHIVSLCSNDARVHAHNEKAELFFNHFQTIMGTEEQRTESVDLTAIGVPTKELAHLNDLFTEDELWNTIRELPRYKAPGPYGYTAEFYQSVWPIIKSDLLRAVSAFNRRDSRGASIL